jgi:hypothetical protein
MDEVGRLLTLLAFTGLALTLLGGASLWHLDDVRRTRRTLRKILGAEPQPALIVRGRGRGVGFDLAAGTVAVVWDAGGWALSYRIDELMGVELVVDDRIAGRSHRGEARRPLDQIAGASERVRLRFVFDDLTYPDFELDLWLDEDEGRRGRLTDAEALQEANRWLARIESLLRRGPAKAAPVVAAPVAERARPPLDFDDDDEGDADAENLSGRGTA